MNESTTPPKSLVLIGFMGCGKSTVGRALQERLGYPLVDMDQLIEERAGKSIPKIFSEDGEESFRDMETALIRELNDPKAERRIVSTGGGIVGREENRQLLRDLGYVIWLKAPVDAILERTSKNQQRPLLNTDDPKSKIQELLTERNPLYEATAHLKLETAGLDCNEVATGILECARYYFTSQT